MEKTDAGCDLVYTEENNEVSATMAAVLRWEKRKELRLKLKRTISSLLCPSIAMRIPITWHKALAIEIEPLSQRYSTHTK